MIDFNTISTDELCDIRQQEYRLRNFNITDEIRDILDSRGSFVVDTPDGQEVYHLGDNPLLTRKEFMRDFKKIRDRFMK